MKYGGKCVQHNKEAEWLKKLEDLARVEKQSDIKITIESVKTT